VIYINSAQHNKFMPLLHFWSQRRWKTF